jgi:hypothetical protein
VLNKPTIPAVGTSAIKDIPASGNATSTQVVMGNDTRLSDARTPTTHTHDYAAISHTHSYQAADADLLAIVGLTGTSGFLKKTAADTWSLDTSSYAATTHAHTIADVISLQTTLDSKAQTSAANTWTATQKFETAIQEKMVAMGTGSNINVTAGTLFQKTISGTTTFTLSNTPATGTLISFAIELTNGGSATVTWFAGVNWPGGTAPVLTAAGVDILGFYSHNGGSTWRGFAMALDSKVA